MSRHTIGRYMSVTPVVIGSRGTLAEAHELMRARGIRHLPVVDDGKLVGVVSQRDLYHLETLRGIDVGSERIVEAMTPEPFAVAPDAALDAVAQDMAEHKYGCAVVVERGEVVGIFTTVDALRALAGIIRRGRSRLGAHAIESA